MTIIQNEEGSNKKAEQERKVALVKKENEEMKGKENFQINEIEKAKVKKEVETGDSITF